MVNRVGADLRAPPARGDRRRRPDIVRAYLGTRQIFDLVPLWQANEALDHEVADADAERDRAGDAAADRARHGLAAAPARRPARPGRHDPPLCARRGRGGRRAGPLAGGQRARRSLGRGGGTLAQAACRRRWRSAWRGWTPSCRAWTSSRWRRTRAARSRPWPASTSVSAAGSTLGWLSQQIVALPADSHWQGLARLAMRSDLSSLARELARSVLQGRRRRARGRALIERLGGAARVPPGPLPPAAGRPAAAAAAGHGDAVGAAAGVAVLGVRCMGGRR